MKIFQLDNTEERTHRIRVCEEKLCDAFNTYLSGLADSHKAWVKEQSDKAYEEAVHRLDDLQSLKYDPKEQWNLNFNDYDENVEIVNK